MSLGEELFFAGEFEHSLDSQRRIAIPKAWRSSDSDARFFLVPGRHQILQLIPFESFKDFLDKARKIPFANAQASLALARLGSRAQDCKCDKQGRIQVPQRLLDYAGLTEHVVLVGAISTIQMWSPDRWQEQQIPDESYLDEVQKIGEGHDDMTALFQDLLGARK